MLRLVNGETVPDEREDRDDLLEPDREEPEERQEAMEGDLHRLDSRGP